MGAFLGDLAETLWPPPGARHGPLPPLMLALTFVTGVVDATSYLRLGHVFVANMTGNVVFIGFALAGAKGLSAVSSLVALGGFLLGAGIGGLIGARVAEHRGHVLRAASALQGALLLLSLIVALAVSAPLSSGARYGLLVPLALAMGVQNASAQRLAVPDLTTTVLTRTLTGLVSEAGLLGGPGSKPGRRALAVIAMLLGALTGGLLALKASIAAPVAVALGLVCIVGLVIHIASQKAADWTRG